ncbi:MAG: CoA-binding protein [Chloroflexi bacterium]|nr:CoA-binding protein [Chloroflexota bacterium]
MTEPTLEERILTEFRTVAVVGVSTDPFKDSYRVAKYLINHGYHVIPVNPQTKQLLGRSCYPDLSSIPEPVEVVDVFRSPDKVMPIVEEAIKVKAKAVWMQEGIVNEEAAARARAAGLLVVMDHCMRREHIRQVRKLDPDALEVE